MRLPNLPPAVIYGEEGTAHKPHPHHPGAARRPEMTQRSSYGFVLPPAKKVTSNLPGDPSRKQRNRRLHDGEPLLS
jgi:hypothetical protein